MKTDRLPSVAMGDRPPTVRIVSFSDRGGGAARAALRLHQALRNQAVESRLRVAVQRTDEPGVERPKRRLGRLVAQAWPLAIHAILAQIQGRSAPPRSPAVFATGLARELNRCSEDIINLHWVCGEMISIAELGRFSRPVVWTLHDAWTFLGAEHLLEGTGPQRHVDGYSKRNRSVAARGPDIDRWTWRRKLKAWRRPITLVCPSEWLAGEARRSLLCRDWPIVVIPNAIDTARWRPIERAVARKLLGLPQHKRLLLFGALGGTSDSNKGADLLCDALSLLVQQRNAGDSELMIFGQSAALTGEHWPLPVHYLGELHDDMSLILTYSAADALVIPSRIENLPYTAIEAQACGTPVVAFATGGIPECVEHAGSGFLASAHSPAELAEGLRFVTEDSARNARMGADARTLAVARYDSAMIARRYVQTYKQVLRNS